MKDVFLDWHLGDRFGWGILGLNLFLHWANDPAIRPLMGHPIAREALGPIDPLRIARVVDAIVRSNHFHEAMRGGPDGTTKLDAIVIDALGNGFSPSRYRGTLSVGRCIFEDTDLAAAGERLARYDALLVGSRWNADLIEAATRRRPQVIFEGVDPSLFCPAPRSGLMRADRFYVFSGGKVEFRKGQDLVLLAFQRFSEKHDDCVLVTAWQSIWPHLSVGFQGRLAAPVESAGGGMLDIGRWVQRNGIDPRTVVDIGLVPNALMPAVLREMDVCLQPSRAEACTNLPVKEAMACGIPVIAGANTGMKDLVGDDRCIVLNTQRRIEGPHAASMEGWGESDVDEIVAALEFAYAQRERARAIGARGREWLIENGRTWHDHAHALKTWLLSLG